MLASEAVDELHSVSYGNCDEPAHRDLLAGRRDQAA
jgi:hypothetical protein